MKPLNAEERVVIESVAPAEMKFYLGEQGSKAIIDGADGVKAARIDIQQQGEKNWSVLHHSTTNTDSIKKDELLVCEIRLRITGERTDVGDVGVYAESAVDTKKGSVGQRIHPTTKLQTFRRSVVSPGDFEPGEFRLSVHLSAKAQVVEIYEWKMIAFPAGTPKEELRVDGITWIGREPDAAWRAEAEQRIEKLRKRGLTLTVTDAQGTPVSGAEVTVHQKRHAWRFGVFLGRQILDDNADGERYRKEVLARYNFVTVPAYLANWGWRNDNSRLAYFRLADWAQQNSLPARGHLLVYPGWTATPSEWFEIPKAELREKMAAHIPQAIRAYEPRGITEWDVANELRFNEKFMEEIGGLEVAADWFKLARKNLPNGKLYLNETIVLPNGGHTETEQSTLERHVDLLTKAGAPIDGIGLQGHFGSELTPPTRLLEILDRMARMDRDIMITEYDMNNDDKAAQADYIVDFYTACFSHPRVKGVVQWGFWETDMWQPRGHHFTKDWQETALGRSYHDMVYNKWWTKAEGATDDEGQFGVRAFQGRQSITVRHKGYEWTREIEVDADDQTIEVIVP